MKNEIERKLEKLVEFEKFVESEVSLVIEGDFEKFEGDDE